METEWGIEKEQGFVIKRFYPHKNKFSILSKMYGRADLIVTQPTMCARVWPGMCVSFIPYKRDNGIYTHTVAIEYTPEERSHDELIALHHILELCYFYLPTNNPCPEIYNLISLFITFTLYQQTLCAMYPVIQNLWVAKFLSLMGFYEQAPIIKDLTIFDMMIVDFTHSQNLEFSMSQIKHINIQKINDWIMLCLKTHPLYAHFKTVRLMY